MKYRTRLLSLAPDQRQALPGVQGAGRGPGQTGPGGEGGARAGGQGGLPQPGGRWAPPEALPGQEQPGRGSDQDGGPAGVFQEQGGGATEVTRA